MSSDTPKLIDTQPLDSQPMDTDEVGSSQDAELPWGWLVLLKVNTGTYKQVKLSENDVTMGRDVACQIQLDDSIFTNSQDENIQYIKLSRIHFAITRDSGGVTLIDKSMNGTYVNKLLVGRGNKYKLNHADVISVLYENFNVFLYFDEKCMRSIYPTPICSKYLVGREVGRGSSGVVREGFMKGEDKEKFALKFIYKQKY